MNELTSPQETKQKIAELLDDLPPASLAMVEQFVQFMREQVRRGRPVVTALGEESAPFLYPTVLLPCSVLDGLVGLMPPVGGDALADTEALYDQE